MLYKVGFYIWVPGLCSDVPGCSLVILPLCICSMLPCGSSSYLPFPSIRSLCQLVSFFSFSLYWHLLELFKCCTGAHAFLSTQGVFKFIWFYLCFYQNGYHVIWHPFGLSSKSRFTDVLAVVLKLSVMICNCMHAPCIFWAYTDVLWHISWPCHIWPAPKPSIASVSCLAHLVPNFVPVPSLLPMAAVLLMSNTLSCTCICTSTNYKYRIVIGWQIPGTLLSYHKSDQDVIHV